MFYPKQQTHPSNYLSNLKLGAHHSSHAARTDVTNRFHKSIGYLSLIFYFIDSKNKIFFEKNGDNETFFLLRRL